MTATDFDPRNLKVFRARYPEGENLVAAADVERPFRKTYGALSVSFVGLEELVARAAGS